jgi:hypothetical protein
MLARIVVGLVCLLALGLAPSARADEAPYGSLDFSRLTKSQDEFFWKRLKSLAVEEAILTYCGAADDFEAKAEQGIHACVTAEAMNKAKASFKTELASAQLDLKQRKASCKGKPAATQGWLGVEIEPLTKGDATGALLLGAVDGSPAAAAGLKAGDTIVAVNGAAIAGPKELTAKIRAFAPGDSIQLSVERDNAERSVSLKLSGMAFDPTGRPALDMPTLVDESKEDLKKVADEVTDMCAKCKSSIWAVFCR